MDLSTKVVGDNTPIVAVKEGTSDASTTSETTTSEESSSSSCSVVAAEESRMLPLENTEVITDDDHMTQHHDHNDKAKDLQAAAATRHLEEPDSHAGPSQVVPSSNSPQTPLSKKTTTTLRSTTLSINSQPGAHAIQGSTSSIPQDGSTTNSILSEKEQMDFRSRMIRERSKASTSQEWSRSESSRSGFSTDSSSSSSSRTLQIPGVVHEDVVEQQHEPGSILQEKQAISASRRFRHRSSRILMSSSERQLSGLGSEAGGDSTTQGSTSILEEKQAISSQRRLRHRSSRNLLSSEGLQQQPPSIGVGLGIGVGVPRDESCSDLSSTYSKQHHPQDPGSSSMQVGVAYEPEEPQQQQQEEDSDDDSDVESPRDISNHTSNDEMRSPPHQPHNATVHHPSTSDLVSATLVVEDEDLVVAEVVSQKQARRRRMCFALFFIILVGTLVGVIVALTTTMKSNDSQQQDLDPRCLVPLQEQPIESQCACLGRIAYIPPDALEKAKNMSTFLQQSGLFDNATFVNQTSCEPHNQALWWISNPRNSNIPKPVVRKAFSGDLPLLTSELVQRYILVLVYFSMSGETWDRNDHWLTPESVCLWFGVTCTLSFRATFLELPSNGLQGTIPREMGFLSHLQTLNLGENKQMTGTLPSELSLIRDLRVLDLGGANLVGGIPEEYFGFEDLQEIILRNNSLTGTFPPEIANLQELRVLDLAGNKFSSTLPSQVGNMTSVGVLILENNNFTGPIPREILSARRLKMLKLSGNQFTGKLPSRLGLLRPLSILDVKNNMLTGTIPAAIANLTRLSLLSISGNKFEGTVPEEICQIQYLDAIVVGCKGRLQPVDSSCSCCYCESALFGVFSPNHNFTDGSPPMKEMRSKGKE